MTVKVDLYDKTSLTRSLLHRGGDRAVRSVYVDSLTADRTALAEAIDDAIASLTANHPDDSSLPAATLSAHHFGSGKVLLSAYYRRPNQQVDLYRAAKAQTTRRVGSMSVRWWRDTTSFDGYGLPNGPVLFEPYLSTTPEQERRPRSFSFPVGVQRIEMPTILDDHPSSLFLDRVGRLNSGADAQFLTTGGFPDHSLLFDGWTSTYVGNGQFLVVYAVAYTVARWPEMLPPVFNATTEQWETTINYAYPSTSFGTLPVHTVLT